VLREGLFYLFVSFFLLVPKLFVVHFHIGGLIL